MTKLSTSRSGRCRVLVTDEVYICKAPIVDCPFCDHAGVKTMTTRSVEGEVRRSRACGACGERFSTVERISSSYTTVTKGPGREPEAFSRTKLRRGIEKAAAKIDVDSVEIDAIVDRVVKRLRPTPTEPTSSSAIGQTVLRVLASDRRAFVVARVRYAIVFLGKTSRTIGFKNVRDFLGWLEGEYGPPEQEQPPRTPAFVVNHGHRDGEGGEPRDASRDTFKIKKLEKAIGIAAKGRGTVSEVRSFASDVAARVEQELSGQVIVTTQQIASEALKILRVKDPLAYLRYAAVVKRYSSPGDFWLEALALLNPEERRHADARRASDPGDRLA